MIERMLRPNWIKDALGVLFIVATGLLYATGVTQAAPMDCGAAVDDDVDVEAVEAPIDAVSQILVIQRT